jgi:hypothetical protein
MPPSQYTVNVQGNPQGIVLGDHNQVTMVLDASLSGIVIDLFQADYDPIRQDIEALRLVEAEAAIHVLGTKIEQTILKTAALAKDEGVLDFYQRVLLALGNIHILRSRPAAAKRCWQQAQSLKDFSPQRQAQAAFLLTNLGEIALLEESVNSLLHIVPEREKLSAFLAWLQGDAPTALGHIAGGTTDLDLVLLRLQIQLATLADNKVQTLVQSMGYAWDLAANAPLPMLTVAELSADLLQQIVLDGEDAESLDRGVLLTTTRARLQAANAMFAPLANSYPEGYGRSLVSEALFHLFLGEHDQAQEILAPIRSLPSVCREKATAGLLLGEALINAVEVQHLEAQGALNPGEAELLAAQREAATGHISQAERSLEAGLSKQPPLYLRQMLVGNALRLKLYAKRFEEAERLLESERVILPLEFLLSLQCLIILNTKGALATARFLRTELFRFPQSRSLLQEYVQYRLQVMDAETDEDALPFTGSPTDPAPFADTRQAAQKLVKLLPCPEARVLEALATDACGETSTALAIVQEVEEQGYQTRRTALYRSRFLLMLGRNEEAAQILEAVYPQFLDDYTLSGQLGTAWEANNDHERAITVLAPFRGDPRAGIDLYINLGRAYLLSTSEHPENASLAFDVFREAFARFPLERRLPAWLMQAGEAAWRGREAWHLVGSIDLRDNPHLQLRTTEEALPLIHQMNQQAHHIHTMYSTGTIPFATLAARSPRPAWFLWWARMGIFERAWSAGASPLQFLLVNLPLFMPTVAPGQRPHRKILIERTALLTWGALGIVGEMLAVLQTARYQVYLFPGCMAWLDEDLTRLEGSHCVYMRNLHGEIVQLLLAARTHVDVRAQPSTDVVPTDEQFQHLGPRAFDIAEAEQANAYYLDDYCDNEALAVIAEGRRRTSAGLLGILVQRGQVTASEAARLRKEYPETFAVGPDSTTMDFTQPIMVAAHALLAWYRAGILTNWVNGAMGWPHLIVGPAAWADLMATATECRLYREALAQCRETRLLVKAALKTKQVQESPSVPRINIKLGELNLLWQPALEALSVANKHDMAICADDLFYQMILHPRGLMAEEDFLRPLEARVRKRFPCVQVLTTERLLQRLVTAGKFSALRAGEITWRMHQYGYRGLDLDEALMWLLHQTPYQADPLPLPYARLFEDLALIPQWLPVELTGPRRHVFARSTMTVTLQRLIAALWIMPSGVASIEIRRDCADRLLAIFEQEGQA